jgi:hypothetical protein
MADERTPAAPQPAPPAPSQTDRQEITIVSHCTLFYWWPVWAVGFLMFLLSYFDGHRLAVVPDGTEAIKDAEVTPRQKPPVTGRDVLVLPAGQHLTADPDNPSEPARPKLHIAMSRTYGVLWATVLLLVIVITNIPLRGMWSIVVIITVVMLSIIFALAGWWETILANWRLLDIRINAGGYLFISTVLFLIWLGTIIFFDRQIYMVFTPGQLKVRTEIGGGEHAYDAIGMTMEKQRSDLFRHWILGLGSGDLVVKTSGAQAHHFDLPNVLFIGKKVQQIEEMMKRKAFVGTR